jgi:integral membrane sensor domain MASE1
LISIFVGALLTTISNQLAPMVVLGISLGNTFEAFVGAFLLNRMTSDDETDLNFLKDVTAYFVASGLGAAASAVVGTSTLILFGGVDHKVYDSVMWTWWIGDFIGALLILPATRVIARTKSEFKLTTLVPIENRAHMVGVVAVLLFAISVVMFLPIGRHVVPLLFLPVLLGAMFVSPPFGTLLGFLIACASIGFTLSGHSPFRLGTENQNLIHVQLLVAAIMLSSSFVG